MAAALLGDPKLASDPTLRIRNALDEIGLEEGGGLSVERRSVQRECLAELADGHRPLHAQTAEHRVCTAVQTLGSVASRRTEKVKVSAEQHRLELDQVRGL